jgi:hypothetical protein
MSKEPVRLAKEEESEFKFIESLEDWALRNAHILLPLAIILLILLIVALVATIVVHGGANVTMVESGNWYNHLQDVI